MNYQNMSYTITETDVGVTYTVPTWTDPIWPSPTTPINPLPKPTSPTPIYGWKCPNCGRGNAPWSNVCPCIPVEYKWTC